MSTKRRSGNHNARDIIKLKSPYCNMLYVSLGQHCSQVIVASVRASLLSVCRIARQSLCDEN